MHWSARPGWRPRRRSPGCHGHMCFPPLSGLPGTPSGHRNVEDMWMHIVRKDRHRADSPQRIKIRRGYRYLSAVRSAGGGIGLRHGRVFNIGLRDGQHVIVGVQCPCRVAGDHAAVLLCCSGSSAIAVLGMGRQNDGLHERADPVLRQVTGPTTHVHGAQQSSPPHARCTSIGIHPHASPPCSSCYRAADPYTTRVERSTRPPDTAKENAGTCPALHDG